MKKYRYFLVSFIKMKKMTVLLHNIFGGVKLFCYGRYFVFIFVNILLV